MSAYMPASKNQEHITPDRVWGIIKNDFYRLKNEMYDPCPAGTPFKAPCFFNSLYGDWEKLNYLNCPYEVKTLEKFVYKAIEQSLKGNVTIMLCPSKTDQEWFHVLVDMEYNFIWIKKRLKFKGAKDGATGAHFLVRIA